MKSHLMGKQLSSVQMIYTDLGEMWLFGSFGRIETLTASFPHILVRDIVHQGVVIAPQSSSGLVCDCLRVRPGLSRELLHIPFLRVCTAAAESAEGKA